LALSLDSLNELSELSQWSCHDDSTVNIGISIITVIIVDIFNGVLSLCSDDDVSQLLELFFVKRWDTAAAAPLPFRLVDPALCGSRPLVTPIVLV